MNTHFFPELEKGRDKDQSNAQGDGFKNIRIPDGGQGPQLKKEESKIDFDVDEPISAIEAYEQADNRQTKIKWGENNDLEQV